MKLFVSDFFEMSEGELKTNESFVICIFFHRIGSDRIGLICFPAHVWIRLMTTIPKHMRFVSFKRLTKNWNE